jgi:hypothetical protein|tara:strand:+ start:2372 stop:2539 length:168 start_codon:yes stop_codon:yes gene_type:complete
MSKRNGRNKIKLSYLDEINKIDKRLKRKKIKEDESEKAKLISKRDSLRQKLKTKK